jgi:hypothetical protein
LRAFEDGIVGVDVGIKSELAEYSPAEIVNGSDGRGANLGAKLVEALTAWPWNGFDLQFLKDAIYDPGFQLRGGFARKGDGYYRLYRPCGVFVYEQTKVFFDQHASFAGSSAG